MFHCKKNAVILQDCFPPLAWVGWWVARFTMSTTAHFHARWMSGHCTNKLNHKIQVFHFEKHILFHFTSCFLISVIEVEWFCVFPSFEKHEKNVGGIATEKKQARGIGEVVLVTSKYHMERASRVGSVMLASHGLAVAEVA